MTFDDLTATTLRFARDRYPTPMRDVQDAIRILENELRQLRADADHADPTLRAVDTLSELAGLAAMCRRACEDLQLIGHAEAVVDRWKLTPFLMASGEGHRFRDAVDANE